MDGSAELASRRVDHPIRAAELVGALSLATDLGTGQPLEHALRTAVLAVRLGEFAGASPEELADTYYVALLHASGCTSNGHEATLLFGEDIEHRAAFFLIDPADPAQLLAFYRTHVGPGRPPEVRERMIEAALSDTARARDSFAAMCEVAQRFARWLELGPGVELALEYVFARWDGKGLPRQVGAEELPLPARLLHVARDFSLFITAAGPDDARAVLERRAGAAYDPRLAQLGARHFSDVCAELDDTRTWEHALESEPFPHVLLGGDGIDAGFAAFAALAGLKTPWLREHSVALADLAEAAAWRLGLPAETVAFVRRAALAADLGRVGVSNAIWEKPGPLGFGEWERVRLHPHFTERAFAQSQALAPIGLLAGSHHERLDGSGYHRGLRGSTLDRAKRILAAADCYTAMRAAEAVSAGARAGGCRGGAATGGRRGTARCRGCRRGTRRGGSPRRETAARASGWPDATRAGGPARARARPLEPGDCRRSRHLRQDRRAPRSARLPEGGRPQPRRRDGLGLRARSRPQLIGR